MKIFFIFRNKINSKPNSLYTARRIRFRNVEFTKRTRFGRKKFSNRRTEFHLLKLRNISQPGQILLGSEGYDAYDVLRYRKYPQCFRVKLMNDKEKRSRLTKIKSLFVQ
jgi:hypothetical protein